MGESECCLELLKFEGCNVEEISEVGEELPNVGDPLKGSSINQHPLCLRFHRELVGSMQKG